MGLDISRQHRIGGRRHTAHRVRRHDHIIGGALFVEKLEERLGIGRRHDEIGFHRLGELVARHVLAHFGQETRPRCSRRSAATCRKVVWSNCPAAPGRPAWRAHSGPAPHRAWSGPAWSASLSSAVRLISCCSATCGRPIFCAMSGVISMPICWLWLRRSCGRARWKSCWLISVEPTVATRRAGHAGEDVGDAPDHKAERQASHQERGHPGLGKARASIES